jgi:heat shock protein HslJ
MVRSAWHFFSLALSCAFLGGSLLGCGNDKRDLSGENGQKPIAQEPHGTYILTESEGYEPVPGTVISFSFNDGELGFGAGCNGHGATYRIDDGKLIVGNFSSTDIGCDTPLHQQDEWLVQFLSSEPHITLSGDVLTVSNDEATLTLLDRKVADPDRPLLRTVWHIDAMYEGEFATGGEGVEADLVFGTNSEFTITGPCNTLSGTFEHSDETVTVIDSTMTEVACEDPTRARLEQHLWLLFSPGENYYSITQNRLRFGRGESGVYALSAN